MAAALNPDPAAARTLVIAPKLLHFHYVTNENKRISAMVGGPRAGVTRVLMEVRLTDATTGELIAAPQFYGGGGSALEDAIGGLAQYLGANLETAVGGPTGAERDGK